MTTSKNVAKLLILYFPIIVKREHNIHVQLIDLVCLQVAYSSAATPLIYTYVAANMSVLVMYTLYINKRYFHVLLFLTVQNFFSLT